MSRSVCGSDASHTRSYASVAVTVSHRDKLPLLPINYIEKCTYTVVNFNTCPIFYTTKMWERLLQNAVLNHGWKNFTRHHDRNVNTSATSLCRETIQIMILTIFYFKHFKLCHIDLMNLLTVTTTITVTNIFYFQFTYFWL